MSKYVVVIYYGKNVTVWILDITKINPIISVSQMSWLEYFTTPLSIKPHTIYRTFNKLFKEYEWSFELYRAIKKFRINYILQETNNFTNENSRVHCYHKWIRSSEKLFD